MVTLVNSAINTVTRQITFKFQRVKTRRFTLRELMLEFTLVVHNGSSIPMVLERVVGILSLGPIQTAVNVDQLMELGPGKTNILSFTIQIENSRFLIELGDALKTGGIPQLFFRGKARAGMTKGRTFEIPINQRIPIALT